MKYVLDPIKSIENAPKVINGYLQVPKKCEYGDYIKKNINEFIMIGMEDAPVKGWSRSANKPINENHNVNLIYASAIPIDTPLYTTATTRINTYRDPQLIDIANTILIAEYFGALQIAYNERN